MRKSLFGLGFFIVFTFLFFNPFFLKGALPIPVDTIVGLYHPYRDAYAKDFPRGIPFKNFLITDPVRQQIPWRMLSLDLLKKFSLPLWNPYSMAGYPLMANVQSAPFYPLNIIFLLFNFKTAWSLLVFTQLLLSGVFTYYYLKNIGVSLYGRLLSSLAFSFSGFSIAWLEWNTVMHTALWLPLLLLSIDKIIGHFSQDLKSSKKIENTKYLKLFNKSLVKWLFVFIFALCSAFLAGHLQTFMYLYFVTLIYFFGRLFQKDLKKELFGLFAACNLLFLLLTAIVWYPTLQFILLSARNVDLAGWTKEGWFLPWQHLIQFVAPDFFGNPTTLNYWGVWNYAEFIGYVGIVPLMMAVYAVFFRFDKKTIFFGVIFLLSLILSLPTIFAKLPYMLNIPFFSTAQPTRLLFLTDFSLAILAGLGMDYYLKKKDKLIFVFAAFALIFSGLWLFVYSQHENVQITDLLVSRRNIYLPTLLFVLSSLGLFSIKKFANKGLIFIPLLFLILLTSFDMFRFAHKFTPFTNDTYFFPTTEAMQFLQRDKSVFRIMSTDSRILPPNFSTMYKLQTIDGYDPLYLLRYGELIAASERNEPNIMPPFGFNRIITPQRYESRLVDLLGVKYVLSLTDITSPKLRKVFTEGQTQIYENVQAFPRAFFVKEVKISEQKNHTMNAMFDLTIDLKKSAIVEMQSDSDKKNFNQSWSIGSVSIIDYSENKIVLQTEIEKGKKGFLVLTDSHYPTWRVTIDTGSAVYNEDIVRANYHFRGVIIPEGKNTVIFYNTLGFAFK